MDIKELANTLPTGTIDKETLYQTAIQNHCQLKSSSIYWLINRLIDEGFLIRVGRNKYVVASDSVARKPYHHHFSDTLQSIVDKVATHFPLVIFQAWESTQFNRFANHQISQNLFFIEVENMLESAVYEFLRNESNEQVLLKPDLKTSEIYAVSNTIIVQNLITEAPTDPHEPHHVMLEKLLVDMFAEEKMRLFLEENEFCSILEEAFHTCVIDESKMFRYARRRHIEDKIKQCIAADTNIELHL